MDQVVKVRNLNVNYAVHERKAGFREALKSLFHREKTEVEAVKDISFSIRQGEIVGFLGPNGAGKTTTLKALSGLLYPTSGTVRVAGYTPQERSHDFLREITLLMGQKQQLLWDLSAADSFQLNKIIYDIPEERYRHNLATLTDMLGIEQVINKPQRTLSLGERMKCELAAAMLHNPKVLFLDEPTIGMDANVQHKVRQFIADYRNEFDATIILTSHYMNDVTVLADRILVVDCGCLIFEGSPAELTNRFSNQKLIKLIFSSTVESDKLSAYGSIKYQNGMKAEIYVERDKASTVLMSILSQLPVVDVSIEEVPFEDVLNQLLGKPQ